MKKFGLSKKIIVGGSALLFMSNASFGSRRAQQPPHDARIIFIGPVEYELCVTKYDIRFRVNESKLFGSPADALNCMVRSVVKAKVGGFGVEIFLREHINGREPRILTNADIKTEMKSIGHYEEQEAQAVVDRVNYAMQYTSEPDAQFYLRRRQN